MITEQYRKNYIGEFVVLDTGWRNGRKHQNREWVPNLLVNDNRTKRAAVIGSSVDKTLFDPKRLENHRGGLLNSKSLQLYGTNDVWHDLRLDFFVSTNQIIANKLAQNEYGLRTTLFSSSSMCLRHPGKFFMVPFSPPIVDLAKAVYLACFDEHREVFLLGYNKETPDLDDRAINDINSVMTTYPSVKFVLVGVPINMPDQWRKNRNVRCMKYQEFIYYADV